MAPMLLTIDAGNTSIAFGLYIKQRLVHHFKASTFETTDSSLKEILRDTLQKLIKKHKKNTISGACVSSVVPHIDPLLKEILRGKIKGPILFAQAKNAGIKVQNYDPREIGADRLVNAVAASQKYKGPLIIIDFGTATTFDYVNNRGEYSGGAICPGIELASRALYQMTAKLPLIQIKKPKKVVGQKTKDSMQSGLFHGYVGLIDHLVLAIKKETKSSPRVIATGGLAPLIAPATKTIEKVEPHLTLEGLRIIWQRNQAS